MLPQRRAPSRIPLISVISGLSHERMDSRGYHRGLPGAWLSVAARILAVADVTDALKADRPYRKGMPPDAVAHVLRDTSGTALCPSAVEAVLDVLKAPTPPAPSSRSLFSLS